MYSFVFVGVEKFSVVIEVIVVLVDVDIIMLVLFNLVVSIGVILVVFGICVVLWEVIVLIVGYLLIIGEKLLCGMVDMCFLVIGVDFIVVVVGWYYGVWCVIGILDCWLVYDGDYVEIDGVMVWLVLLLMIDLNVMVEMVCVGCDFVGVVV